MAEDELAEGQIAEDELARNQAADDSDLVTGVDSGDAEEWADSSDRTAYSLAPLDLSLLTNPAVMQGIVGLCVGFAVLSWPSRTDRVLSRLIGVALLWLAFTVIRLVFRPQALNWLRVGVGIGAGVVGAVLVLTPDRSSTFLGRTVGMLAVVAGLTHLWRATRSGKQRLFVSGGALVVVGLLVASLPTQMLATATTLAAIVWIGVSLVVIAASLDARRAGVTGYRGATALAVEWLHERPKSVDARQSLYAKILYDGSNNDGTNSEQRIVRFFALMGFAAVIASMGVITDSTAVVIGAMLIAPLMTPLMGMAISLVMGWPNRLARSALIALGGILFAIGIGVLLGLLSPAVINTSVNSQIVSRSSPTILDLIVALAAGAAGAYGLSRPDVSDSLPGVAIAIALVPPLTVVGISYSQGDWSSGNGALLLFTTNMVAILVMGGLTFIMTGVTPLAHVAENQQRVRTAVAGVSVLGVLVLGALFLNGNQIASNAFQQSSAEATVVDWLEDYDRPGVHSLIRVDVHDDEVVAVIVGPSSEMGDVDELAVLLSEVLDREVTVTIRLIVEEQITSTGG